ncbi:metal ABC transporter substrate-binding protein [Alkalicoccus urumqiensis]|uniref:Metal ABC transporter substrate-binding protein n=2 Tax=Alkalicoccus urumqiensis TaxID=1548213 RepID=A0A2P6MFX7_ALKUR|nr:metal ABC transporter substrate-binding protein [Alkalicoccus urumqiensis]
MEDRPEADNETESSNDSETESGAGTEDGLSVAVSFSVLADITAEVMGERGTVDYVVPIGEEPHEYEPVPSNFQLVSDADVFYTNGMNLEEWIERMVENTSDTEIVEVTQGVEPIYLEGSDSEVDPHVWLNPANVETYVENIRDDLSERDPEGAETYEANAEAYLEEISALDADIEEMFAELPEERRLIVVTENAFKYFGEQYEMETAGIWELNSHEEGTTGQINRTIDLIREREVPAVFVETTVDPRFMESVADSSDVEIAGEVYTDAVGQEGSGAETYLDMIRHNAETFAEGLAAE